MAEAFANSYGAGIVNAGSAGLCATHSIARETFEVMQEKGISLVEHFPKDFEPSLAARYDIVVNISGFELPPVAGAQVVEWDIRDPNGAELSIHRNVREEIEAHVRCLIEDLRENGQITRREWPDSVGQRIAPNAARRPRLWQRFTNWF